MIVLESEEHDDNDAFCRSVLASSELIEFLRQNHIVVWGGNVRHTEAFQVSNILEATTYPFIAIISLQTHSSGSQDPTQSVIDRIEGPTSSSAVIRRLQNVIARTEVNINRMRQERERREQEQELRREQERAYNESLRADREREKRMARERLEAAMREKTRQSDKENRNLYIRNLCEVLKKTPSSEEKTIRVSFRMADGSRAIRKFKDSDTLETLYQFVEAYPHMETYENDFPLGEISDSYVHKFKFTLHSAYPRTEYQADPDKKIADELSLWPSATLIVDAEDEDEEQP
ncbi:UBX domain-containing protein [Sporodiniella umbellata]|nr:UBX domain-containing protein [Sporodiniella umbellata]